MNEAIAEPRAEVGADGPKIVSFEIPIDKIGEVIGPKGKVINTIQQETGADIASTTTAWSARSPSAAGDGGAMDEAERQIKLIVYPPQAEVGEVYQGRVVNITKFGAFVNILPGRDGLVHISKLGGGKRIDRVEDVLDLGDEIEVRVDDIDDRARSVLSPVATARRRARRRAAAAAGGDVARPARATRLAVARARRPPRRAAATCRFEDTFDAEAREEFGDLGPAGDRRRRRRWAAATVASARRRRRPRPPAPQRAGGRRSPTASAAHDPLTQPRRTGCGSSPSACLTPARSPSASGSASAPVTSRRARRRRRHFLEHLLFKGTDTGRRREIAAAVDRVGGDMNAFTAKEYTAYYCRRAGRRAAPRHRAARRRARPRRPSRRRHRDRAPGHPRGAGHGRRRPRRRRPPRSSPRRCSPSTRSGRETAGTRRDGRGHHARRRPDLLRPLVPAGVDGRRRSRRRRPRAGRGRVERRFAGRSACDRPRSASPRHRTPAGWWSTAAVPSRRTVALGFRGWPATTAIARLWTSSTTCWAAGCRAGCSRRSGSGGLAYAVGSRTSSSRTPAPWPSTPAPGRAGARGAAADRRRGGQAGRPTGSPPMSWRWPPAT